MQPLQLNYKMAPDVCWVCGVEEEGGVGGLEVLIWGDREEGGVSKVLEDVVEKEKELEDNERKDVATGRRCWYGRRRMG